jgi:hypothetical protein
MALRAEALASLKRKFGETKHKFDEVNLRFGASALFGYSEHRPGPQLSFCPGQEKSDKGEREE